MFPACVMVVKEKSSQHRRILYEGGISFGGDVMSHDVTAVVNGFVSVTRTVKAPFHGELEYVIYNHSAFEVMGYVKFSCHTAQSYGEVLLRRYFGSIGVGVLQLLKLIDRVLTFSPDTEWWRFLLWLRKK